MLGVLLLAAAGLKAYGFGVDPVARTGIFSAPAFQFFVILFEIGLGIWLLSGQQPLGSWLAVLLTFSAFAAISFCQGCIGQASCGCLGKKVTVNPWIMFGIDLTAVTALLICRPNLRGLWDERMRIAPSECLMVRLLALLSRFHVSAALALATLAFLAVPGATCIACLCDFRTKFSDCLCW